MGKLLDLRNEENYPENFAWLGFDSRNSRLLAGAEGNYGMIAPGATVYIVNRPQLAWRGRRLFVHQSADAIPGLGNASDFLIHSLKVGNRENTIAYGAIPADAFAFNMSKLAAVDELFQKEGLLEFKVSRKGSDMMGMAWTLPLCQSGVDVTITVENLSGYPRRFIAGFQGVLDE